MYVVKLGIWKSILCAASQCHMGMVGWDMLALGQPVVVDRALVSASDAICK